LITDLDGTKKDKLPDLFTPTSAPYGISYSEWTVRWWKWCLSQPKSRNPVNDRTRADKNAANNQTYPEVWFLAGTTGGYAERECSIPRGKSILCPIINYEISTTEDPSLKTDKDLVLCARTDVDKIAKVDVMIDGVTLSEAKKFRIESGPFDVTLPLENLWGVKPGPTRAAADGYWLFLKPLQPGKHRVQFGGSCLAGTINIGTVYYLTVDG
jgi:hypothetical protein